MIRYCWFHDFEHPFDGVSDGWMCHAYQPVIESDGSLSVNIPKTPEDPRGS